MTIHTQNKYQMNFRIKKRLQFGEALYISGDIGQLGAWDVFKAARLTWNEKDIWTIKLQLQGTVPIKFQYKYFISFWNSPHPSSILWQDGSHNRIIYTKQKNNDQIIDDKWNMQKISLNLMIPQHQDVYNIYSVIGNYIQLGNWKTRIPLTKKNKNFNINISQVDTDEDGWDQYNIYSHTFEMYRGRDKFRYYYIRQANYLCQPERHPGRLFVLGKQNSHHPDYFKTVYNNGKIQLYEKCNFQLLNFSQITQKLFLGAYPKTVQDIKTLKKAGINAILSIQTQQDFVRHEVSEEQFQQVCALEGIESSVCSIKDMDKNDFLLKAEGALQILKRWSSLDYTIYIHCSAGIYRSPQIMILHLISACDYKLQKAIQLVKSKHPYANPNIELVLTISQKIKSQKCGQGEDGENNKEQRQIDFKQQIYIDFKDESGQHIDMFEYQ